MDIIVESKIFIQTILLIRENFSFIEKKIPQIVSKNEKSILYT